MTIGFVETISSPGIVRLDDIVRIAEPKPNANGVMLHKVWLRDGQSFETVESENGGLLRRPVQIIAPEPGTYVIWVDGSYTEERRAWRARVVAWALCLDGELRPVTPNGVCDGQTRRQCFVELPGGSIEGVGEYTEPCGFKDAQEMIDYFYSAKARSDRVPE